MCVKGIIRQPVTREDEIHNCQAVIDVLSNDVIKDNLSHIRGTDIVDGKVQAINNLIDIFSFLFEYVIKQIESDVATDTEGEYSMRVCLFKNGSTVLTIFLSDKHFITRYKYFF